MKKVRYAAAAASVIGAAPALGLMVPAASAAAPGAAHAPTAARPAKAVSQAPLVTCGGGHIAGGYDSPLQGFIYHSGLCINTQVAELYKLQTGLTERVRAYSADGYMEAQYYRAGKLYRSEGLTEFRSTFNNYAYMMCEALVANSNHAKVEYGPVCEYA